MFLPIGDAPNPKGTPLVTYALIAANVAAFFLLNVPLGSRQADVSDRVPRVRGGDDAGAAGAGGRDRARRPDECLRPLLVRARVPPQRPAGHGPAELHVPSRRLHAPLREHAVPLDLRGQRRAEAGGIPFLLWYLLTGAIATLTHALVFSSSDVPLVGASGAISGVLGFSFLWFPRNTVRMPPSSPRSSCRSSRSRRSSCWGCTCSSTTSCLSSLRARAESRMERTSAASSPVVSRPG